MASGALSSSFGGSFKPTEFAPSKADTGLVRRVGGHGPSHKGFLGKLLADAITTAKGIPYGVVQTVEHPVKTFEAAKKSYAETYGHGFGHFWKEFNAHPLQPLLDAISVPLIFAGGAGLAVKGADLAANVGRGAEAVTALERASELASAGKFAEADAVRLAASRSPGLTHAADLFRKGSTRTTRMIDTGHGFSLPKSYSSNLWRHAMSRGTDGIMESLAGKGLAPGYFSKENLGQRLLEKETSKRAAATAARSFGQARALKGAAHASIPVDEAARAISDNFHRVALDNVHKVDITEAQKLSGTQYAYIKAPKRDAWQVGVEGASTTAKYTGPRVEKVTLHSYEPGEVDKFINNLGGHFKFTSDPKKAWVDENGQVSIMRHGQIQAMRTDISGAAKLMGKIYRTPLTVWKHIILADSPRYLVNNMLGNAGMYTAATNPVEFSQGVLGAIRSVHGVRAEARAAGQMGQTMDAIMAKALPTDFVSEHFGYLQHGALGLGPEIKRGQSSLAKRLARSGLYEVTEKAAYRGPQRASIMGAMSSLPEFRTLMRTYSKQGMSWDQAFQRASKTMLKDPRKSAAIEKRVTDWAGQYYHLNDLERKITAVVPFYNWVRHALRFGKEQTLSRPVSSAILSQIGALGDAQAKHELGNVPDFLKGAIPVTGKYSGVLGWIFGQQVKGRQKVLLTAGINPLAAAADDANALASIIGQGHGSTRTALGGQVNPIISGIISGVTGERLFSGAKAPYHGPLQGAVTETFGQLPYTELARRGLHGLGVPTKAGPIPLSEAKRTTKTKRGEPTLYTHDMRQIVSSLMGLNERDFSPKTAQRLYAEEEGIKKGQKRGHKPRSAKDDVAKLKGNLKSSLTGFKATTF